MKFHCGGQSPALRVATSCRQFLGCEGVIDPFNDLFDDGPLIKIGRDVVGRSTGQLHAARVGLVVGLGTFESGQERVVDIHRASTQAAAKVVGQHLHVACQHDQVAVGAGDDL